MKAALIPMIQGRAARVAASASALRGQKARGMTRIARQFLAELPLREFGVSNQRVFRRCLDRATIALMKALPRRGRSWGIARKLLNIFLRDALYTRYLADAFHLERVERWLEVPLDSITAEQIEARAPHPTVPKWLGVRHLSAAESEKFQFAATRLARPYGVARVHMDAVWWGTRQEAGIEARANPRLAISVRQPFAEMILRGMKSIEVRSQPTRVRERVYVYASAKPVQLDSRLRLRAMSRVEASDPPAGVVVGAVRVIGCLPLRRAHSRAAGFRITGTAGRFAWLLAEPTRLKTPRKPKRRPQAVWFVPF